MSRPGSVAVRAIRRADLPRVWEMVGELAVFEKLTALRTGSAPSDCSATSSSVARTAPCSTSCGASRYRPPWSRDSTRCRARRDIAA